MNEKITVPADIDGRSIAGFILLWLSTGSTHMNAAGRIIR